MTKTKINNLNKQKRGFHASKEMKMDSNFVQDIISKEGYSSIDKDTLTGLLFDTKLLQSKFSCHYNLDKFNDVSKDRQHIVTGFGPTNAPTGGTLSMILKTIFFEKETGIDSTIIISNLGAFNSRNINIEKIDYLTERFVKFIRALGFKGELRTHNDFDLLVASSLTSKVLTIEDFLENKEVTTGLYEELGIQGKDFSTFVDINFTIADILLPCILKNKERILVFVGIEEYYFPKLANMVLKRFNKYHRGQFVPSNALVGSLFGHLIGGLDGFSKMSKSIPESSINLDDSEGDLKRKILKCSPKDELIIFQMMNLVSDWDSKKIEGIDKAFKKKDLSWNKLKGEYLEYFLNLKKIWETTVDPNYEFKASSLFDQYYEKN